MRRIIVVRSQLCRSRFDYFGPKDTTKIIMGSRSAGNPHATWERKVTSTIAIRPSTQGSWECPKSILAMAQGKLNDKE